MKCDVIAEGIIEAAKSLKLNIPLVVRLQGRNMWKGYTCIFVFIYEKSWYYRTLVQHEKAAKFLTY